MDAEEWSAMDQQPHLRGGGGGEGGCGPLDFLHITLKLWPMSDLKRDFLLTISLQYQVDKWENREIYQLGDYKSTEYQILSTNVKGIV